jgi:hypothetical protein
MTLTHSTSSKVKMKVGTPKQHGKAGGNRTAVGAPRGILYETMMQIKMDPTYTI